MGCGRRHCPAGRSPQIACGTDPQLLLSGIQALQQRCHTPLGTASPSVLLPGLWLKNFAICMLFWLTATLDACLKSNNCTSSICEFYLSRLFSAFCQLFFG